MPGTATTIIGNLVFQSGALYLVQVSPSTATYAGVIGTASLAGTVNAYFVAGSYLAKQYTILTTTGGLGGTTFASLTNTRLPAGLTESLSYSADDVYLNLSATYTGLNINQQNVANALNNYFNTTGGLPAAFFGLNSNGLTQIDGEVATDSEKGAFRLMNDFLNLMLDMSLIGRGGGAGGTADAFAPEQQASFPPDIALAYARCSRRRRSRLRSALDRVGLGLRRLQARPTAMPWSARTMSRPRLRFCRRHGLSRHADTVLGFALAGGGTNWGLAQGLGSGRSDAFQAGVYGRSSSGPAYVVGRARLRQSLVHDQPHRARRPAQRELQRRRATAARLEGGYRLRAMSASDRRHPLCGIAGAVLPHAELQ